MAYRHSEPQVTVHLPWLSVLIQSLYINTNTVLIFTEVTTNIRSGPHMLVEMSQVT